ncbi:MAG: hypothetical protein A2Z06_01440 [Candidatus Glassbacteria bacterium RBG_16_58_8]|uniref:Uncharacterized protein n=1 Tax=Candidatus Glassbacteria bacterium RBG_16_58_8 TaxID=1817866 RepID=A0A1F5YAF5_9BACT|nr:MAG: hypothetical protein A2Z06_01440 [Candidatus Glassbacteria bacterium RBG_16_58_8]
MDRREFIIRVGESVIVVPLVLHAVSCDDGYNSGGTGPSDTPYGFNVTSSTSSGHTHSVEVLYADLSSPPQNGVTYGSTSTGGHSHSITLTQQQLTTINGGGEVTVTSTNNEGHTHGWTIREP